MTGQDPDNSNGKAVSDAYNFSEKNEILDIKRAHRTYVLNFFNRKIIVSDKTITTSDGLDIPTAIRDLVSAYEIYCPEALPKAPPEAFDFQGTFQRLSFVFKFYCQHRQNHSIPLHRKNRCTGAQMPGTGCRYP